MLFRGISMVVSLTITAAFFGWVRSSSQTPSSTRLDEIFTLNSGTANKKARPARRSVAEATP
ncbi:MAG: hypothetical protein RI932_1337 [Pseudomonadota bacterium]